MSDVICSLNDSLSIADSAGEDQTSQLISIFKLLGGGCLMVGAIWIMQAIGFGVDDPETEAANAAWVLAGALFAGAGAGFLVLARTERL